MYQYKIATLHENSDFFCQYLGGLSARYDDSSEHRILNSTIYSIFINGIHSGYFGVYDKTQLTQFFIPSWAFKDAQAVFSDVLKIHGIKNAFVPTCDEAFLSLCLDKHSKVNLHAYFFEDSNQPVPPAKYPREMLSLATHADLEEINKITGDFTDKHEERIEARQLYVLRENGEFLGLGIIEDNMIMENCKETGMFTNEKYRQRGVGRSIILHLKDICHESGIVPILACWYYNHNSKRTLESAGYISKRRMLRIDFEGEH